MSEFETEHVVPTLPSPLESVPVSIGGQSETLTKIEEIIRGAFRSSDNEDNMDDNNVSVTVKAMHKPQEERPQSDGETDANDENAGHYISYTRFESSCEPSLEATHLAGTTELDNNSPTIDMEIRQLTPDILKKTGSSSSIMPNVFELSPGPKPDILQNVAGNEAAEYVEDIVGNFELEVEHELGRVMSGYRFDAGAEQRENDGEDIQHRMQETIECLMSNAEKLERSLAKVRLQVSE